MPIGNANMKNTQLLTGYSMMKKLSRYVNVLEIKRHADGERVDKQSSVDDVVLTSKVGETNVAVKTDTEVTCELVADSRLQAKREVLAFQEVIEGRAGVAIHIVGIVFHAVRQNGADAKHPTTLADTGMVSYEEWHIEKR